MPAVQARVVWCLLYHFIVLVLLLFLVQKDFADGTHEESPLHEKNEQKAAADPAGMKAWALRAW